MLRTRRFLFAGALGSLPFLAAIHCGGAGINPDAGDAGDRFTPDASCNKSGADEPSSRTITFRVRNGTAALRWIGRSPVEGLCPDFEIEGHLAMTPASDETRLTPQCHCVNLDCYTDVRAPGLVPTRVDPGASVDIPWDGRELMEAMVAAACPDACAIVAYPLARPLAPGSYTVKLAAFAQDPGDAGMLACAHDLATPFVLPAQGDLTVPIDLP